MMPRTPRSAPGSESGYALILIMFFLALLALSMAAAAPTILSSIQREKETEMIWRGNQYVRGIRLYCLKTKKYPTSVEDLVKPKTGIRFMRQEFKDPMNQVDGSWRLIYIGPNGQLIGSLTSNSINLNASATPGVGSQASAASLLSATGGRSLTGAGTNALGAVGAGMSQLPGSASSGTTSASNSGLMNASFADDADQAHPLAGTMDASNTIGGNIIGVGSKVNKKSFMVYHDAKNYKLFEFICEPAVVGVASAGAGGMDGAGSAGTPIFTGARAGDFVNQTAYPTGTTSIPPQGSGPTTQPGSLPDPNQ
jgi:type II secretory pathway pseudopilin PulG